MLERESGLTDAKVAIVATDGFEKSELFEPFAALKQAGAQVDIVSTKSGEIKSWQNGNWDEAIPVDKTIKEVTSADYAALKHTGGGGDNGKTRNEFQIDSEWWIGWAPLNA